MHQVATHLFNKYVGGAMITVRTPSDVWKIEKTQVILDRKWKLSSWYIYILYLYPLSYNL